MNKIQSNWWRMCQGIPMKVVRVMGDSACCLSGDQEREINLMLLEGQVRAGDFVRVQRNFALDIISPEEAQSAWRNIDAIWRELQPEADPA